LNEAIGAQRKDGAEQREVKGKTMPHEDGMALVAWLSVISVMIDLCTNQSTK
jgi:hypothetical protein